MNPETEPSRPANARRTLAPIDEASVRQYLEDNQAPDPVKRDDVAQQSQPHTEQQPQSVTTPTPAPEVVHPPAPIVQQTPSQPYATPNPTPPARPFAPAEDVTSTQPTSSAPIDSAPTQDSPSNEKAWKFPWIRALAIGAPMPALFTITVLILLPVFVSMGALRSWVGIRMMGLIPWIAGILIILLASKLLKTLRVSPSFLLSLGTLVGSLGVSALISTLLFSPMISLVGAGNFALAGVLSWITMLLAGLLVMGALLFITQILSQRISKTAVAIYCLLVVGLPFGVDYLIKLSRTDAFRTNLDSSLMLPRDGTPN